MNNSMNECFADNMLGKTVKFDVQPYSHGQGVLSKVTPRRIIVSNKFMLPYGQVVLTYEVFDLEVTVTSGTSVGALSAGVPVPGTIRKTDGKVEHLIGVSYEKLYDAVNRGFTIIIATCG